MTDTPTPAERIASAYRTDHDRTALQRVAATHNPAADAEADRIAAVGATVPLSATTRVAVAYQRGARDAVAALSGTTTTTTEES